MEVCKIPSKKDFIAQIVKLCNNSAKLGLIKGPSYIKNGITSMIELAKASSEPEQQIQLLKETLNDLYKATDTPYGAYLSRMLTEASKNQLFSEKINPKLAKNKAVSSTFEETAKVSNQMRQRNFLEAKFKGSPNAKLYFQRSMKNDMVETFLVKRSGDNPKYFTSQEDMNLNVRAYKQELLDRIFSYFDGDTLLKDKVKDLPRVMYSDGNYNNTIEQIKSVIDSELSPKIFEQEGVKQLEQYYTNYRDGKNPRDKEFLDAYNAWVTLQNFDTIVQDIIGTIIKVNTDSNYNKHTGNLTKYEIKGRATNMWNNWTTSDDIADMSEVVSDVTQMLIETSRMYKWGSGEAYPDRYVSFNDFNYVIGKIKKWSNDPKSDTIFLNNLEWNQGTKPSIYTQRLLMDILNWNRLNGNLSRNPDGSLSNLPKEVTWKQLISRINENPQRYLHAIFDIMCNSDLLSNFTLNDYEKNLIWSFYKETFGGDGNTRSLYRFHTMTKEDNIYQIITQVAASTFPEDYLQYFEKSNRVISTRLLQDYALENIEKDIVNNLQQTANTLDKETYKEYNVTVIPRRDNDPNKDRKYLNETKLSIPVFIDHDVVVSLNIDTSAKSVIVDFPVEYAEQIWNDTKVQKMFKDILGINFEGDPDLKNAYLETVISPRAALNDLGNLVGRTIFNSVVNNYYIPIPSLNIRDMASLKTFIKNQFGDDKVSEYSQNVDSSTGLIPILSTKVKTAAVSNLVMATAINSNLLSQAQSKTGEGTSLANYTLSRMRNFYQNQVEMQCKKGNSAVRDLSFVVNSNNLFEGILSRRELKTLKSNQQSTKFSDQQSFQLSFINDFISGFIPNPEDTAYIKNGRVSFLPTVNSDKTQIDGLLVNLHAKSRISNGKGGFKTYMELTDSEIEKEMELEFKPMYNRIITNINNELTKVYNLLPETFKVNNNINVSGSVITKNQALLNALNNAFASDSSLGKKPKERITKGLHNLITQYNKTHSRNPIMLASQIHYVFNEDGLLSSNKTLEALWGRFNPDSDVKTQNRLDGLYTKEQEYIEFAQRNGLGNLTNASAMFKYQEHLTIKDLLNMKFQINLFGSNDKVRHDQNEIKFLRGQAEFTDAQKSDPNYTYLRQLNDEMKNWVGADGLMILAKGDIDGQRVAIKTLDQLNQAKNLQIHPMLSKLNRLDYLCSQQYTIATVGSHYAHKGGASMGSVLVEEAKRWLASNKRNVAATSTVHLFQNKQLNGAPSIYNVSIIEDVTFDLYNVMGDLYLEGHAPLDGGMFVNAWMSDLENNSLAGEKAGIDKKQFGTFFSELYGAGGIVKTAGFAATNSRMRRQKAWQNLQKAMSNRPWVKEFADEFGNDIPEVIDITKDYLGNTIDYTQAIKGQPIIYKRPAHDNPRQLAVYRLDHIESLGNNQYKIYEVEIDSKGNPVSEVIPRNSVITINTNWDLYTQIFGGYNSLELGVDGKLTWSENSNKLMVHAINNVGYRKNFDGLDADVKEHFDTLTEGLDQDDVWQPLKYSDIHYTPNIGAIKSLQFNVNPDGQAVLEGKSELNFMAMRLAQLGIQLDKEHHADAADVSMPTQIIQACANRSFTSEYAKEIYTALATLTKQATKPFLDGIKGIITSKDPSKLVEEVANLIVDNLLHQSSEDNSVNAILKDLIEKVEKGETLTYDKDIKGKIPWSDPTIMNKLFSSLSTTLTNLAVKMKFAGTLSVICPTDGVEKIYGDRMLNSFTKIFDENGSTRTELSEDSLRAYQESVAAGNEVDSDGHNMLVYDSIRDTLISTPINLNIDTNKISSKTEDFGVIIDKDLKKHISEFYTKYPNGIIAYRVNFNNYDSIDEVNIGNIGNPFSETEFGPETVQYFYDWLVQGILPNNGKEYPRATEQFRQAILNKILKSPVNTPVLYYKEINRPSHATVIGYLIRNKGLISQTYRDNQQKLSKLSELKTQHNYIIEFEDGFGNITQEEITLNTPEEYFRIKNLIVNGPKLNNMEEPLDYEELVSQFEKGYYGEYDSTPLTVIYNALSKPILTYKSIVKETGFGREEMKKLFGLYKSKENGGVSIEHLAELIYGDYPQYFKDDYEVRNMIIDIIMSSTTTNGIKSYEKKLVRAWAEAEAAVMYNEYEDHIANVYNMSPEEYKIYYQTSNKRVRKIYENVEKGRALGAYNVRYTDKNTGYRFQIYDLDSINLLFNLNNLYTKKVPKGYKSFLEQTPEKQQQILNKIFKSSMFPKNAWVFLKNKYKELPSFNESFIANLAQVYPEQLEQIINDLHKIIKPRVFKSMQNDLFKLSSNYSKPDRQIYANGQLIDPIDIQTDAYELIMPKIYQTQFGLQEFDDLQEILRDKDFFVERGLSRFTCKLDHSLYDYELKNFNGEHYYILDKSKGIPPELEQQVQSIFLDKKKNKTYRVDSDGHIMYELSSDKDVVCNLDGVQVIITENPLFYIQNLNYNTLKVSPKRVTEESYQNLIGTLKESKRQNNKNYLKAISTPEGTYFDLKTFKEFNKEVDDLTYEKLSFDSSSSTQFKSTAQICRIILQNGRELHTAFDESLNLVAGRIPAQSQQSFMTQRVIGFDSSDINTAMVSTFQLFLQGSDLDIDAVTLLGYEFDKNGKFVAWSPYFKTDSKESLEASKNIPLPTGEVKEIYAKADAPNNFFEVYNKYFGTLFKHIQLPTGKIKTINGIPELQIDTNNPEGLELLAEFLRDFNTYGINIKAPLIDGKIKANDKFFKAPERTLNDGTIVSTELNLFAKMPFGLNAGYDQTYEMAKQLLKFANDHNNYLNTAEEHLRDKMSKNYIVHYIYKVAEAPCNQTEAQESVDQSTKIVKQEAANSPMATASDSYTPGRYVIKHKSVGEGQVGKACVGIGAVGIKANSTTQFYISELLNYGSDKDQEKIMFKKPVTIGGKEYRGFANMYTSKDSELERENFKQALEYINQLENPNEVTRDVAVNIAALLSIAVDNAKDLALAKINSGQRLMGMYAYGLTLGIPIEQLIQIMNSTEGRILTEMTEGSQFNNDITAFRVLDIFDKLKGNIGGELSQFDYTARDSNGKPIRIVTNIHIKTQTPNGLVDKQLEYKSTQDALFASMYEAYEKWFTKNGIKGRKAETFGGMVSQLIREGDFSEIYEKSDRSKLRQFAVNMQSKVDETTYKNWIASQAQMINYIKNIESKSLLFKQSPIAKDLRTLAEGAEEMRVLGSILSINKGLKATVSDTETFIDTIENLIYDRKLASGQPAFETNKIDFHRFMTSKKYQDEIVEKYEAVKHSVNIPHLISKVQHFKGYLTTEIIPTSFFTTSSVKYRTLSKYRKNINADSADPTVNSQSLFTLFGVDGKRDKENILKGLENLIQFKLFTRWAYDNKLKFKVPKGFKYFDKKGHITFNPNEEITINLYTDYGLATFKKYMEEIYIPQLKNDPSCVGNEFVKNLTKISFDKTPLHNTVVAYSLQGDLMARKGRQAELNAKMFADFQSLSHYEFNSEISLPDAFYIYSQYCYMGKKGQKSLMSLFDNAQSRSSLCHSFNEHVAKMDAEGNISCSKEELIIWCAPVGTQHSKATYAYVTSNREFGVSLKQRIPEHVHLSEEEREALEEQQDNMDPEEERYRPKAEKFGIYKQEYLVNQYDRLTRNHFLVPITNDKVGMTIEMPMNMYGQELNTTLNIKQDTILSIELPSQLRKIIQTKIKDGQITKFDSVESFEEHLNTVLSSIHIPYKVSLYKNTKQEIDFGILQTIIEQQINC